MRFLKRGGGINDSIYPRRKRVDLCNSGLPPKPEDESLLYQRLL